MKLGDRIFGPWGVGLAIATWGDVAGVARVENGHYWRLNTKPTDAGCGATSSTLLAEGWAQEWGVAVTLVHAAARHLEITLTADKCEVCGWPVVFRTYAAGESRWSCGCGE